MTDSSRHRDRVDDSRRGNQERAKRGRRQMIPDPHGGPVARFAHELSELKRSAGDPSYDRIRSDFGAAASKSALSAAARGQSLPSWETTWEFVRSLAVTKLGADAESVRREWRARWEEAGAAQAGEHVPAPEVIGEAVTAPAVDERIDTPEIDAPARPVVLFTPSGTDQRRHGPAGALAVTVAVIGVLLAIYAQFRPSPHSETGAVPKYPMPGDDSGFGGDGLPGDVTFPDGTLVHVGETFQKTWRIKNTGSVPWENRYLQAFGGTTVLCRSPQRVPIPHTEPGEMVNVSVPVTPKGTGVCHVLWRMVDERGQLVLPGHSGVYYQVNVIP